MKNDAQWVPAESAGKPEICPRCTGQTEYFEDDELCYAERCPACRWVVDFEVEDLVVEEY